MALAFLSEEWFEAALDGVSTIPSGDDGLDARLQFVATANPDAEPLDWVQVIEGGRVREWRRGVIEGPDLEITWGLADAWDQFRGVLDGTQAVGAVRVRAPGSDEFGPPSPMDLGARPELDLVPRIPGADLGVQYEYSSGPWGPVSFALSFSDGRVDGIVLGRLADPDVVVGCSYRQMAQVRNGEIGVLDVLANGGTVAGHEGPLALLAGISESPEFHRAELACGPSGIVLSVLGEVSQQPRHLAVTEELRARTSAPDGLGPEG